MQSIVKSIALCALWGAMGAASAHITLEQPSADAGSTYKAVLRVGHGCAGSATTALKVQIPVGFVGVKPMPKAGWTLAVTPSPTEQGTTDIEWRASTADSALPDAYYDEFVLRGKLPDAAGAMWFKIVQTCDKGRNDWTEVPASGVVTKGLKMPAALLEIKPVKAEAKADKASAHHH